MSCLARCADVLESGALISFFTNHTSVLAASISFARARARLSPLGRRREESAFVLGIAFIIFPSVFLYITASYIMAGSMSDTESKSPRMFKSDDERARYMAAYDAVLRDWPVAYEELDVPNAPRHRRT